MIQTPDGAIPEDEIPLPPLPAAADKDPAALMDTRYVTFEVEVSNCSANFSVETYKHWYRNDTSNTWDYSAERSSFGNPSQNNNP